MGSLRYGRRPYGGCHGHVGKNSFEVYPFQLIYPTIILSFVTVSFYIVGNRFADASDPRNHI